MSDVSQRKPISAVLLSLLCTILSTCLFAGPVDLLDRNVSGNILLRKINNFLGG